jgi:hypothetical protein
MEVSGQLHDPAILPPKERAHGTHWIGGSGRGEEKNSQPLPGLEPPIIQTVAQCYTTELFETDLNNTSRIKFLPGTFSLHHRVQNGSEAHPAYPGGTRGSFLGGKAAGREADHSPPSSAEVKE